MNDEKHMHPDGDSAVIFAPGRGNAGIYWASADIADELRETTVFSEKIRD